MKPSYFTQSKLAGGYALHNTIEGSKATGLPMDDIKGL